MSFSSRQPNGARDLMDVQAVIVPGIGVAACQAGVDNSRENQMLVYNELRKGTSPAKILEMLKLDPNVERRQFGILAIPNGSTITTQNHMVGSADNSASLYFGGQVGDIYQVEKHSLGTDVVSGGTGHHARVRRWPIASWPAWKRPTRTVATSAATAAIIR
jgi:hypothetical protein